MEENEIISAFAFKTGKQIEQLIKEQMSGIQERNNILEAKLLSWYSHTGDESFARYMGIQKDYGQQEN